MAFEDIGVRLVVIGLGEFRRAVGTSRDDLDKLGTSIHRLEGRGATLGTVLTGIGSNMVSLGRTMTLALTAPIVAIEGALTSMGIQFEDSFAGVAKTVDGIAVGFDEIAQAAESGLGITVTNMNEAREAAERLGMAFGDLTPLGEEVREQFRQMGLEIPIPTTELAALGEAVGQLGVEATEIAEVTRLISMLGVATDISAEQAAFGLIRLQNITGETGDSIEEFVRRAGSALVFLGNTSVSTEGEILNLALRIAAAGERAEFSVQQLLAWATTLSDVGSRAEAGGTAVSRMINEMLLAVQTGEGGLEEFASVMGVTVEEFQRLFEEDASQALRTFVEALKDAFQAGRVNEDMLREMGLGGVRAVDIIGRLGEAVELFDQNLLNSNLAWEQAIALEEEAEKRFATIRSQIQLLKNTFTDLGITIFDVFKEDIAGFITGVKDLLTWFRNLDERTLRLIVTIGGIVAAIGPVLVVMGALVQAFGLVATAVGALFSPLGLLVLAMGVVGSAAVISIGPDNIFNVLVKLAETAKQELDPIVRWFEDKMRNLGLVTNFQPIPTAGTPEQEQRQEQASRRGVGNTPLPSVDDTLAGTLREIGQAFRDLIPPAILQGFQDFMAGLQVIGTALKPIFEELAPVFAAFWESIKEIVGSAAAEIFANIGDALSEMGLGAPTLAEIITLLADLIIIIVRLVMAIVITLVSAVSRWAVFLSDMLGIGVRLVNGIMEIAAGILRALNIIFLFFSTAFKTIKGIWENIVAIFKGGDIDAAFENIRLLITGFVENTKVMFIGLRDEVTYIITTFATKITEAIDGFIRSAKEAFLGWVDDIITAADNLADSLVGHSIFPDMIDAIVRVFLDLPGRIAGVFLDIITTVRETISGVGEILGTLFGGGAEAGGALTFIDPEQIAAVLAALTSIQIAMDAIQFSMMNLSIAAITFQDTFVITIQMAQMAFQLLVTTVVVGTSQIMASFNQMNALVISSFSGMGAAFFSQFVSPVMSAWPPLLSYLIVQMEFLNLYWRETCFHMIGHWEDFAVAVLAQTDQMVFDLIHKFDFMHEVIVGKFHSQRDAFRESYSDMINYADSTLAPAIARIASAFGTLGPAAQAAAEAAIAALMEICEAAKKAEECATASPELKIQHPFERFEKYLKQTKFAKMIESQFSPTILADRRIVVPPDRGGDTIIDQSTNMGNISGVPMSDENALVNELLKFTRLAQMYRA